MSQTTVSLARGYCHIAVGVRLVNGCLRRQSVEAVRLAPSASVGLGQCVPRSQFHIPDFRAAVERPFCFSRQ
jgi:hypothetical protein